MFFELLTGEFLFSPKSSRKWSRDEDHITLMIELLGEYPPRDWAMKGKYAKTILNNDARPKKIKNLKFWSLVKVLMEKYAMSEEDARDFSDFLLPMLHWVPEDRVTAEEALKHPWLQINPDDSDDDDRIDLGRGVFVRKETASYEPTSEYDITSDEEASPTMNTETEKECEECEEQTETEEEKSTKTEEVKDDSVEHSNNAPAFGTSASSSETRESQSEIDLDEATRQGCKASVNTMSLSTVTEKQSMVKAPCGLENIPPICLPSLDHEEN